MDVPAVELVGIHKMYRLFNSRGDRLREALHPFGRIYHHEHWSLRDITLSVAPGSTVGILGVNGSGKSTLLQIVAGVLQPTLGTCRVRGRVAALLELGAGFNPEMTGRENVVTNALILGLDRREIDERIDAVETFAEIGEYFDQPVKTYSTGMFMRVAFAMAIHVDPDVLIVDEALAVGDTRFQEKCFRRIRSLQQQGRTILYVTHDRASVTHLCTEAVLLHDGRLVAAGAPDRIVDIYTEILTTGRLPELGRHGQSEAPNGLSASQSLPEGFVDLPGDVDALPGNPLYNRNEKLYGHGGARIIDAMVVCDSRINPSQLMSGCEIDVLVRVAFDVAHPEPLVGLTLSNTQGVVVYATHSGWLGRRLAGAEPGEQRVYRFRMRMPLAVGSWFLDLAVAQNPGAVSTVRGKVLAIDVLRGRMLDGLVDLGASIEEVRSGEDAAAAVMP